MKNYLKRTTTFILALLMLLSVPLQAFAEVTQGAAPPKEEKKINYDKTPIRKGDYVNKVDKLPVVPAKPGEGVKSADYIKDPDKPKLYTVRSDFKVQRGDDEIVSYQPYIATVGEEKYVDKTKINKTLVLPVLDGYTSPTPTPTLDITYDFINDKNKKYKQFGDEMRAEHPFIYQPKKSEIGVKHLFQDFNDLEKFGKKPGLTEDLITKQTGLTGTIVRVQPLPEEDRKGYVPESTNIMTQIPENNKDFIVEYRYKRAYFDVVYDTKGKHLNSENVLEDETEYGTSIPTRRDFYEQRIPNLLETEIPTKIGSDFLGWMPSVDLKGTINGADITFKQGEVIKDSNGNAILDLYNTVRAKDSSGNLKVDPTTKKPVYKKSSEKIEIIMPSEKLTFIGLWTAKPKADYAIQFWTEKADHADDAKIEDKYEFIGTRVYKDQVTGSRPNLDLESPGPVTYTYGEESNKVTLPGLKFPDLNDTRLQKIWNGDRFNHRKDLYLNKFYVYNKKLTDDQNGDKTVSSTGKTVYNIYYDRQVYDLYFTESNVQPKDNTIYPEIWGYDPAKGEAVMLGGPGNPYHYKARFNEMMYKWPNDAKQTKGFTPGYQSFGWGPNYYQPNWPLHLDTPPYRLNADEFLDMANYDNWGGYVKKIDKGDGTSINLKWSDFKTLSFGIKQEHPSIPHHMDFWMDGFKKGETIIRYDLVRTKADTAGLDYGHRYPIVQGFTPYGYDPKKQWPSIAEGREENGRVNEGEINDLNDEREEITPNNSGLYYNNFGTKLPIGQLDFIPAFFNNADEYGDPVEGEAFETNGYLRFKYHRNKYPLRFNFDPTITRDDNYFKATNSLQTFYEFPLLSLNAGVDVEEQYKIVDEEVKKENESKKRGDEYKTKLKSLIDNPNNLEKLGLTDLVYTDPKDGKLKVKRPDNITDQMEFKGWALDPAGTKLIWQNKGEKMPTHPVNLYAKWAEPDYQWKVTIDPDGGKLEQLDINKLTDSKKTIRIGDVGQEEEKTFPIKGYKKEDYIQGDKQVFTVIHRQKLNDFINKADPLKSIIPTKKGYEFMGWEVLRYKKDEKGDYTDELDLESSKAYREKYKFPEIYAFGNDVVAPIYLKAIWIKNDTIDIPSYHHFLDDKYNETQEPTVQWLRDRRVGSYLAAVGSKQNDERILIPKEEWGKLEGGQNSYKVFKELNGDPENPRVNSYIQQIRIEPPKIKDEEETAKQGKDIYKDNPKAKNNEFHFYYRPFRKREYKVNYIDERFKGKADGKTGAIIGQETVINGKRHFDARNFRTIPGWKLVSAPQQQLIFDINEDTNEFLGINGTGKDEITFYYKDVRVIEVPGDKEPPKDYVRVTFKADKGGAFTDKEGKSVTELNYDVIKGLKSDFLPVPKELAEGKEKEADKYYITPDDGRKFIKWDEKQLLNKNTIVDNDTKDFYVFTAKFDWSGAAANPMVVTEAFKDKNADATKDWSNKFAPTIEQLKKQIVWKEKVNENGTEKIVDKPLPAGTEIKLYDEVGNELTTNEQVYDLVKELNKADKEELVRTVNIKAKVTFKDGKDPQELTIPITVYKNRYEALNKEGDKPLYLKEAEGKEAKDGGLKDVTGDYVKVTIKASKDFNAKDDKIYYVNKNAWVEIPEVKTEGSSTFVNWTADKDAQNKNGIFDFAKRHKFTENTVISPSDAKDVVEQTDPNTKPNVPNSYVKVIVKTTDNATDETKFEKTFWVNPTKEVTIPVTEPKGKTDQEVDIPKLGKKKVNYVFKEWQKVQTGQADDSLTKVDPAVKIDLAKNKYTDKVTVIEAAYYERFAATPIVKPIKTEELHTPEGKEITDKDLIGKITPPENKEIESITVVAKPDPSKPGKQEAKVTIKYKDGSTQGTNDNPVVIPVEVHKNIIPAGPNGEKPEKALENYVKVIFKAGTGGSLSGDLVYYVSPEVEVDMTESAGKITKKPNVGYISGDWDTSKTKKLIDTFKGQTEFTFNFTKTDDIVEKIDENTKKPEGYVTVKLIPTDKAKDNKEKVYFVNPKAANVTIKYTPEGKKETISGIEYTYVFNGWTVTKGTVASWIDENINGKFTQDTEITANYSTKVDPGTILPAPMPKTDVVTAKGDTPKPEDLIKNVPGSENNPLPAGTTFNYTSDGIPDVDNLGKTKAKVEVKYPNGKTVVVEVPITVVDNVVPQPNVKYVITDVGVQPTKDKYREKITPPAGKEINDIEIINKPDVSKRGVSSATIKVTYKDGTSVTVTIDVIVQDKNMPPTPGDPDNPDKPNPGYPGGPDYPSYPGRPDYPSYPSGPIPRYPEIRYETIVKEKIVKVPVPVTDGYFKEVRYMQGFNGYFRPNDGLTRAEAAQILANALVEDGYKYNPNFKISYKDIGEAWYTRAVKIVTEAKVFAGYDDGNFKPQAKITRNEWISTLKRFQELGDASGNNMKLRDDHWAKAEIQAAFNEGWLKIYTDGLATYKGDEFIPRQEVAAVSNKAFKRIVDKTYIGKNNLSLVTYKDVNSSMWAYEDILCASNTFLDRKDRYIAHWVKEDKNQFNIDISDLKIVQKNFQRNSR